VPGSHSFHWSSAFATDGKLLPEDQIRGRLRDFGYQEGMTVVTYCTRGIRSSFLAAVLTCAGFNVTNYAGTLFAHACWHRWPSLSQSIQGDAPGPCERLLQIDTKQVDSFDAVRSIERVYTWMMQR
jgi:hypothetical protein